MTKENVKAIQTALWVGLVLVQMAVVGCLEVHAEMVRREVTYEAIEGEADLPSEIDVSVLAGNEEELVACRAVEQMEKNAYWQDDFSFPLTFYDYGAEEYRLGEQTLKAENLTDIVEEYGEELLESMDLPADEYEISGLSWSGEAYVNEEGVICRDAVGHGSRLLRDYRVVYEGYVDPQRWNELKRAVQGEETELLVQEAEVPETEEETEAPLRQETMVQIEEKEKEAELESKRQKSRLQEFLEKVTKILLVAVSIGAIFFFGGLLVMALLQVWRKLWERKNGKKG